MRYILALMAIFSVLGVSAATFGTPYQAPKHRPVYITQTGTPMPTATMSSMDAAMMSSGSTLPMAAVSGTTTANDYAASGPHRAKMVGEDEGLEEGDPDPSVPVNPNPLGDAALPLYLLACVYICARAFLRNKKRVISR
ncbi:MAG: hypothetical protein IJR42_06915 [Paludibacteraceae bacterium]|nr:hypothetical protein [Paludibacteraceae bacterium]